MDIKFRQPHLEEEFTKLNTKLKCITWYILCYVKETYGVDLECTQIFRTQAEQDEIYRDDPKYIKSPWMSVHQSWRGIDFSIKDLGAAKAKKMAAEVNEIFPYGKGSLKTVLAHEVGSHGFHLHVQVKA